MSDKPQDPAQHVVAIQGCGKKEAQRIVALVGDCVTECANSHELGKAIAKASQPSKQQPPSKQFKETKTKP